MYNGEGIRWWYGWIYIFFSINCRGVIFFVKVFRFFCVGSRWFFLLKYFLYCFYYWFIFIYKVNFLKIFKCIVVVEWYYCFVILLYIYVFGYSKYILKYKKYIIFLKYINIIYKSVVNKYLNKELDILKIIFFMY